VSTVLPSTFHPRHPDAARTPPESHADEIREESAGSLRGIREASKELGEWLEKPLNYLTFNEIWKPIKVHHSNPDRDEIL